MRRNHTDKNVHSLCIIILLCITLSTAVFVSCDASEMETGDIDSFPR